MRHLNKENQEIFLILKILLKDGGQIGFLYGKDGRSASLFIMDLLNSLDIQKRVLFVSPKSGDIYRQILQKLGRDIDNLTVEQFLIEFYNQKEKLDKRVFIVIEDSDSMDQTDIINLIKIFGGDKDISVIFTGSDKLDRIVEEIKPKKIFSYVNFVFQLKGKGFPFLKLLIALLIISGLSAGYFYLKDNGKEIKEDKVKIVKKDKEILKSLKDNRVVKKEPPERKKVREEICDFVCLFDKTVYPVVINNQIPDKKHKKPVLKERYRIYAGAFRNLKNARFLSDRIFKKTGLKAEIEDLGSIKNVYIKAYRREEALEIRDRLNEIGIKPYIKRLEK
ncbi:MAG TPA: hypothetical protein DEP48_04675 [Persephonella sp.]|uniref:ORC1/DEAH AAA+ ATPase domain-containing protein n=1 Tax=Persephonella marina (strain DSM 14350 / EX-H1) TaxID=123214 RepID=C0QQ07_PERMH|nr:MULTISPECIES: SPOR domain-containing protein [Persephonella]ACO04447.1 hypothetical protein PERMA_0967 [Persephonella marina EX-H1]HCB69632.1 hypothetical protein [Persephonella sp.]